MIATPTTPGMVYVSPTPSLDHERARACVADILASLNAARLDSAELHEIVAATTEADRRRLMAAASSWDVSEQAGDEIGSVIERLLGELVTLGRASMRNRGYMIVDGADAANLVVGVTTSRRQKTLAITERAVLHLGRAVRASDLADYVRQHLPQSLEEYRPLVQMLARDLMNLGQHGELIAVQRVRGGGQHGSVLYLPARLEARRDEFAPRIPLTWLDYVQSCIATLWRTREESSDTGHAQVRPISTREVRAYLRADLAEDGRPVALAVWRQNLDQPGVVQLALDSLAKGRAPSIRAVPDRTALWVPSDVDFARVALEATFATDADRIVEAVHRAMVRLQLPAVTSDDVMEEIGLDEALSLSAATTVARTLSDMAKHTVAAGTGDRRPRRGQRIHRVGKKAGSNLYCATAPMPAASAAASPALVEAKRYATHEVVLRQVSNLNVEARLAALGRVRSPVIALARARLLAADLAVIMPEVERLANDGYEWAQSTLATLARAREDATGWTLFRGAVAPGLPVDVVQAGPTLTPSELQSLFATTMDMTIALPDARAVVRRFASQIRRVVNNQYVSQRSGDPRTAQRYLFDAVDARCYGVRLWGGAQARLAALMAEDELGELRDGRYVLRALGVESLEQRLRVIAALAFLQPDGVHDALRERARNDVNPGVRELAIWALGFSDAPDADAIVREAVAEDPSEHVRRAAQRFVGAGPRWAWRT